jgi:phosphatidylglycerophosphate synthase
MNEYLTEYTNLGLFVLVSSSLLGLLLLLSYRKFNKSGKNIVHKTEKVEHFEMPFVFLPMYIVIFLLFLFFLLLIPFFVNISDIDGATFFVVILFVFLIMTGFAYFIKTLEGNERHE